MRKRLLAAIFGLLAASPVWAQPPVAPTGEPTQSAAGDNVSEYNIRQSFELGYRYETTGGDLDMYRSSVNYTDGIRLLSGSLSIQSRDGHGRWFDQIVLNTLGLGNDPYESAELRVEKNRIYRYDLSWRSDAYYNPGLTVAQGEHLMNTVRRLQDHDLTLFPQSKIRFFLGYANDGQSGPALTTIQLFDANGGVFPLFSDVHTQQNEYRLGGEAQVLGFTLNVLHGWEDFKEDTPVSLTQALTSPGSNPLQTTLQSFQRSEPYHGTSPYWRVGLFREGKKWWALNGRFSYVAGQRAFLDNENSLGISGAGASTLRQVLTYGNAQRPTASGNLTFSLFPGSKVTFTNQTSVYNIRMTGDSFFEQYTNGSAITPILFFNYLGILTIANTSDVQVHVNRWFSVHGGYDYTDRRVGSVAAAAVTGPTPFEGGAPLTQTNLLNAGTLGVRVQPVRSLTILLDGEIGRANRPLYPIAQKDYQSLSARIEYRRKTFRLAAFAREDYNTNSASLASFASHSRQYSATASWTPSTHFAIDAGYDKLHLDSLGGIAYFASGLPVTGNQSYYISNIHTGTLSARFTVRQRADISVGYSHVQDTGDGRASATGAGLYASLPALQAAQTFPLRFLSPQARVSIRLSSRLRWNAGYQYYGYREDFSLLQDYRAHTGYSSLSWSF